MSNPHDGMRLHACQAASKTPQQADLSGPQRCCLFAPRAGASLELSFLYEL